MTVLPSPLPGDIRIAIVGDVHDQWSDVDHQLLHQLAVDLVLLVGDFGNEAVDLVRQIAGLDLPKAVVLGNHDAWYTATDWGRKKCPYDRSREDRVQQQLDALGTAHVGYDKLDFDALNLTVVGGRPFSWGGADWKLGRFYQQYYGVSSMADSGDRICQAIDRAAYDTILFIGHGGPTGLGNTPEDPCGRDWKPLGGDFGDPDLAVAIAYAQSLGKRVPLVGFGHMHHRLRHRQDRQRQRVHWDDHPTLYLNAASVPRRVPVGNRQHHNFSLVTLRQQTVVEASLIWVDDRGQVAVADPLYQPANVSPLPESSAQFLALDNL